MAKQTGILQFNGTINGITFYNSKHGLLVRQKGGPDPKKMKTGEAFVRVRENGKEFGACGKSAGFVRRALLQRLKESGDLYAVARLIKQFMAIKQLDTGSARGQRKVSMGLGSAAGKALLNQFDFNAAAPLSSVLKKSHALNTVTGAVSINHLHPLKDMKRPRGATHVQLRSIWLKMNLGTGKHTLAESPALLLPVHLSAGNINIQPITAPTGNGTDMYILQVCFFQEINGAYYALNNGTHSSMAVVGVG